MLPVQTRYRPTVGQIPLSDGDRGVGADLRRLRLQTALDSGLAAVHDPFDRVDRRSGARAVGRAARDHVEGVGRRYLDSDRVRNRLVAPDHLGAFPYLAIEHRSQSPLLTDYTPARPGRRNRQGKARAQAAAQRDADTRNREEHRSRC
jgi:hypothetical protein